jgi:hypothetical protein
MQVWRVGVEFCAEWETDGRTDERADEYGTDNGTFSQLIYRALITDAIEIEWDVVGSVRVTLYEFRRGALVDKVMNLRFHDMRYILGAIDFLKRTVIHGVI